MSAIAIDFGTSNTIVCAIDPVTQTPRTLQLDPISRRFQAAGETVTVVPTQMFVQEPNQVVVGEQVRSQRLGFVQPERYFQGFKRDLVADYQPPPRELDGQIYTPELVSELFLQTVWQQVTRLPLQPSQVILTVPVGAFERYLDWFRDVAAQLQLPNVQIVDESTAAALGYAVDQPGAVILVVDFGGGTLDLSLVRTVPMKRQEKVLRAEVLAKSDAYVGGVDIDTWIVEHYLQQQNLSRSEIGELGWQNLLGIAEKLKIRLSTEAEVRESWFDDESFMAHELHLTQPMFEELLESRQLLEQIRQALDEVIAIAFGKGISKTAIEQVLLVGGSCQIPAVQQLMVSYFGRSRVKLDKPFEAVAHGALALSQVARLDDYLRHSYAIRLWEPHSRTYSFYPLFTAGARYPCNRLEPLTLQVAAEGQSEIRLDIGEVAEMSQAEVAYDAQGRMTSAQLNQQTTYRSLESDRQEVCVAHLDPPGQIGVDRISVWFEVNEQRTLIATVKDLLTGEKLVDQGAIAKLQ